MNAHAIRCSDRHVPVIWLSAIVAIALVVRIVWALVAQQVDPQLLKDPFYGDAAGYNILALNLLRGLGLTWDGVTPTAYRMPGYPAFLAFVYAITGVQNLLGVRLIQAVIGAALCAPVFAIARRLVGHRIALVATLATAVFPTLVYLTGWLYSETLFMTTTWLGIAVLIYALDEKQWEYAFAAGLALGLALLIRPEIAGFPALLLVVALFARWPFSRIRVLIIAQVAMLLIVVPWAVRNRIELGTWVMLTTNGGSNFYAGNNADADGRDVWVPPLAGMSEVESDQVYMQRGLKWILDNPLSALGLVPRKLGYLLSPLEQGSGSALGRWALLANIPFGTFLLIGAAGWLRLHVQWRATVLAVLILWYALIAAIIFGGSRLALPIIPAFIILASGIMKRPIKRTDSLLVPTG